MRDRDYFRRTIETRKPVISEPYMGRGLKEPTVMMTAPVLDSGGAVVGMLTGAVHTLKPNFLGKLRQSRVGASGRFALINKERTIIVSFEPERLMAQGPPPGVSPVFDHAVAGREGWEEAVNSRGLHALYSYKPLASVPWVLLAALPVEEAYAPITAAQHEAIGVAALLALLLAPLVWFGMQRILAPIVDLRDTIHRIRGDPESEALVRVPGRDELGDLAEDFNALIRERRLAGQAQRASEERYRSLAALSSDWYWEQDENFRFTAFHESQPGRTVLARSPTALGKTPWELASLNMSEADWAMHRALLEAHQSFRNLEVCRPDAAGKPAYAVVSGAPRFGADGRFLGYRGVGRDITAQRQAAAALRASEERFAKAFRASPMFICISTAADGRYIDVNDAYLRGLGHAREDIIGRTSAETGFWKHPGDRARVIEILRQNGRVGGFESEMCGKSGETRACELWGEPIEVDGVPCIIWAVNDITGRKRAENEVVLLNASLEQRVRVRTAELQEANRELESFSYTISHDLRTPLRGIAGFSALLVESMQARLGGEDRRYLERIITNADKMSRLIDEVLEYSRLARATLQRRQVDLDALVGEVAAELREHYPAAEVVAGPLGRTHADPTMIRQIFHNLIGNALKYSARHAHPRVEIGAQPAGGGVEYFVRDNGIGFDMDHADRLFKLFTRLHSDPNFEGTGAGLAIVKRLVERHHGKIRVEAKPDQGATFWFSVSRVRKCEKTRSPHESVPQGSAWCGQEQRQFC